MTSAIDSPRADKHLDSSVLSAQDLYLFNQGRHYRAYNKLGAHLDPSDALGTRFSVWAPNARAVSVIGTFNQWDERAHPLTPRANSGIWEGAVPDAKKGDLYKFRIWSQYQEYVADKADPFGVWHEAPPRTASQYCSPLPHRLPST